MLMYMLTYLSDVFCDLPRLAHRNLQASQWPSLICYHYPICLLIFVYRRALVVIWWILV